MAEGLLSNSVGAFRTVSDFRTGKDADGFPISVGQPEVIADAIANGAIAVGDVVVRVVPTATQGLRFAKSGASATGWTYAGVAVTAAAGAGSSVQIVSRGYARVNVGATTPVIGDVAILSATAGQADVIAAGTGVVAATVAGTVLGEYLGTKDAGNLAAVWLDHF